MEIDDTTMGPMKFDILQSNNSIKIGLRIYEDRREQGGGIRIMQPVVMKEHTPGNAAPSTSTFDLEREDLQRLADTLYQAGFKPTDLQSGSEVEQRMQDHIDTLKQNTAEKQEMLMASTKAILLKFQDVLYINGDCKDDMSHIKPGAML